MSINKFREKSSNEYIFGRNAVKEALKSGRVIDYIMIAENSRSIFEIIDLAKKRSVAVKKTQKQVLDSILPKEVNHQGVAGLVGAKESCTIDEILNLAEKKKEKPFLIIADGIEDPHNLGAIIRTAECVGAHGIIIPKRRAVGLTLGVGKSSAGALEHVLVAKVNNISSAIDVLKDKGLWIYGADMMGKNWTSEDLTGSVALVIGSEGKGISQNTRKKCDFILSIPMKGKVNSLNASVAAGILMYEVCRQRLGN